MDDLSTDAADVKAALQSGFISQDIAQVSALGHYLQTNLNSYLGFSCHLFYW
jgi:hypothetical protein